MRLECSLRRNPHRDDRLSRRNTEGALLKLVSELI